MRRWRGRFPGVAVLLLVLCVGLQLYFTKKSEDTLLGEENTEEETPGKLCVSFEPYSFTSFGELEQYEKGKGSWYYIPAALPENYELSQITRSIDGTVILEYALPGKENILSCRYQTYADSEVLTEKLIRDGYEEAEYDGRAFYRRGEDVESSRSTNASAYEIAFFEDGKLFFMQLPKTDTFENMLKYAEVEKVDIR